MLRRHQGSVPSAAPTSSGSGSATISDDRYRPVAPKSTKQVSLVSSCCTRYYYGTTILLFLLTLTLGMFVQKENHTLDDINISISIIEEPSPMLLRSKKELHLPIPDEVIDVNNHHLHKKVPPEFAGIVSRALLHQKHCQAIGLGGSGNPNQDHDNLMGLNNHTAHLPQFGILNAIHDYEPDENNNYPYKCTLPPEQECAETQFTVIFMAYNPDRLKKLYNQIFKMVTDKEFAPLVAEIIVVWNGERHVEETKLGQALIDLSKPPNPYPVRISYPLQAGFPNDLMNRYHPRLINVQKKTKAILYYDDDGPFYSYKAILGGFELWKRNANAQIGAMARKLDYSIRQRDERQAILNGPGDRFFLSHCPNSDTVHYNFNEFANFGANMVLPSGSFLHVNYLCFLWHPIFEEIRQYVKQHPVNPDDGTVSVIVSQLAGRAPKVYSRRINESKEEKENENKKDDTQRRRLLEGEEQEDEEEPMTITTNTTMMMTMSEQQQQHRRHRRRLMDGIDWDHGGGGDKKQFWGQLRSDAANSLVRYFGSMNSGSIGWCYGTKYQVEGEEYCHPEMARVGQLPWLKPDHTARDVCP